MHIPPVAKWGESDQESFADYYKKWPEDHRHVPKDVIENWIYLRWGSYREHWIQIDLSVTRFEPSIMSNGEIMEIGHTPGWIKAIDDTFRDFFSNPVQNTSWLGKYMLMHGTWPSSIIVLPNQGNLEHPRGGKMAQPFQLIEGHMRLGIIRKLIKTKFKKLEAKHDVWLMRTPDHLFQPTH